ncbi:MAG: CSLREA domain-containing protein [Chloroflexi bacterium]|nr:CSLREA domain-containing protein [Chloroflexota bacterium]
MKAKFLIRLAIGGLAIVSLLFPGLGAADYSGEALAAPEDAPGWHFIFIPGAPAGVVADRVWASAPNDVYVWLARPLPGHTGVSESFLYHWNGMQWSLSLHLPGYSGSGLYASGAADVFAAASGCQSYSPAGCASPTLTRMWHFDGAAWSEQALPPEVDGRTLRSMDGLAGQVMAGVMYQYVLRFDGSAWMTDFSATVSQPNYVNWLEAGLAHYVGCHSGGWWDGTAWSQETGYPFCDVYGMWGALDSGGAAQVYAVGNYNFSNGFRVWKYNAALHTYQEVVGEPAAPVFNSGSGRSVWGSAADDVYAVGMVGAWSAADSGRIYHFDGSAWTRLTAMGDLPAAQDVHGSGADDVWVSLVDGRLLHYGAALPIYVDAAQDDTLVNGNCTLREAIIAANSDAPVDACQAGSGADVILLPAGEYRLTLPGMGEDAAWTGDLDILASLEIRGAGRATTLVAAGLDDSTGYPVDRVFHILPNAGQARLEGLGVTGGTPRSPYSDDRGCGILNEGGLALVDSRVFANSGADEYAGVGGGVYNSGLLEVMNSAIEGNAANIGGGVYNLGELHIAASQIGGNIASEAETGGGLQNDGWAVITDTLIGGNYAAAGGAIGNSGQLVMIGGQLAANGARFHGGAVKNTGRFTLSVVSVVDNWSQRGGAILNEGTMTVTLATLSGNDAADFGGAVWNAGELHLLNSTLSGNRGGDASIGSGYGGALKNDGSAWLTNVTLYGNSAGVGGGVHNLGWLQVIQSIFAANPGGSCAGTLASAGGNFADDATCGGFNIFADLLLGPLQMNGGATPTHALLRGSPAMDAIPAAGCALSADQRGVARPQGLGCDAGAFETEEIVVAIDIRPLARNFIDLTNPAPILVAALSSEGYYAPEQVSIASQTLGRTGNEASLYYDPIKGFPVCKAADVNGDGRKDLVCKFTVAAMGFQCGDTLGVWRAWSTDGALLAGQDRVMVAPCK